MLFGFHNCSQVMHVVLCNNYRLFIDTIIIRVVIVVTTGSLFRMFL